ncbi:MAG TPA: hypothetical protein VF708_14835 [Pyrinomonadaceae bacterium]|jgi:hypothetical protein
MRYTFRPIAFVLTLSLGTIIWYTLAYRSFAGVAPVQSNVAAVRQTSTPAPAPQPQPAPARLMSFGPVERLSGFTNAETLVLRRKPEAGAQVVARLKLPEHTFVEILGATRDFIHVKFPAPPGSENAEEGKAEHEGWTTWGTVVPNMSAIVLDAGTGAVVARVPLGEGATSVAYSPDGSHALFYKPKGYGGPILGYEVTTEDYALKRSLLGSDSDLLGPVFYSPVDGTLAAFGRASVDTKRNLSLMRLADFYTVDMPTKISAAATAFIIAPDGRTGIILHPQDGERGEMPIDMVDLQSLEIRNTIWLGGSQVSGRDAFVLNRDASEIYLDRPESDSVAVIDSWTGQTLREIPKKIVNKDALYFTQSDLVGDSLFARYWTATDDDMHARPRTAWLSATGAFAADREIESVIEAGDTGFAINEEGTLLFRLDKKHHIRDRLLIERPELGRRKETQHELTMQGLSASPDGKRIIVFIGIYEGC